MGRFATGTFCVHGFDDKGRMKDEPYAYYTTAGDALDALAPFEAANPNAKESKEPETKGERFVAVNRLRGNELVRRSGAAA